MKEQLTIILLFFQLIIITISCHQKKRNVEVLDATIEDSTYTIIPHDTSNKYTPYIFDEDAEITSLIHQDFVAIDSLYKACIINYNNSENNNRYKIDISKRLYRKQLIAVLNNKGEKEVWVNCFCDQDPKWKIQIATVFDGGNCYFNFKVNLSTKKYYGLKVNGSIDEHINK